jgi:predicted membrane channel-forming protein YqfA (hemolysin III family)
VQYLRPGLRGWLHLVWFEVSLIAGTLMLAITHGAARITAVAVYTATVSGLFGTSASWHRETGPAAASRNANHYASPVVSSPGGRTTRRRALLPLGS